MDNIQSATRSNNNLEERLKYYRILVEHPSVVIGNPVHYFFNYVFARSDRERRIMSTNRSTRKNDER